MSPFVRRSAIVILALAAPVVGRAQTPDSVAWQRFWPAAVGDEWQYYYTTSHCNHGDCGRDTVAVTFSAVQDTVLDSGPPALVFTSSADTRFSYGLGLDGRFQCRLILAAGSTTGCQSLSPNTLPSHDDLVYPPDFRRGEPLDSIDLSIGGQTYAFPAVKLYRGYWGTGRFGADLGLYEYDWSSSGIGGSFNITRFELRYARVSGTTYGARIATVDWERFWPAAVGDTWQYRYVDVAIRPYGTVRDTTVVEFEVVGDTVISGAPLRLFVSNAGTRFAYGLGGSLPERFVCYEIRYDGSAPPCLSGPRTLPMPGGGRFRTDEIEAPAQVRVNQQTYTVPARKWLVRDDADTGASGADIGMLRYFRRTPFQAGPGLREQRWHLMHASVGGQAYGTHVATVAWERFWPAAVGDEWMYAVTRTSCDPESGGACRDTVWTERFAVVGDTALNGSRLQVFVEARGARCAFGIPAGAVWFVAHPLDEDGWCPPHAPPLEHLDFPIDRRAGPQAVSIGDETYTLGAVRVMGQVVGSVSSQELRYGADVGLLTFHDRQVPGPVETRYTLVAARVGGVLYGESTEEPVGRPLSVALRPNPVSADARVAITLPTEGPVLVEVVDLLGRVVLKRDLGGQPAGDSAHVVDVSALAPGVYVLRTTHAAGVAIARFVRAD